jgi:esterase FrsA
MSAPSDKNLSETLFNKVQPYKIRETSTISSSGNPLPSEPQEQFLIDGLCTPSWFRVLRRAFWIWQGAEPIEGCTSRQSRNALAARWVMDCRNWK